MDRLCAPRCPNCPAWRPLFISPNAPPGRCAPAAAGSACWHPRRRPRRRTTGPAGPTDAPGPPGRPAAADTACPGTAWPTSATAHAADTPWPTSAADAAHATDTAWPTSAADATHAAWAAHRPAPPTPPTPPAPPARVGGRTALPGTETCERPGGPAGPPGARAKLPGRPLPAPPPQRFELICDRLALMLLYRLTLTLA